MSIIHGSMRHTMNGRKKKPLPRGRKKSAPFIPLAASDVYRRETPQYKSVEDKAYNTSTTAQHYKQEISSRYTIAPAYNKGAYQVISLDNVKDIGK